MADGGTFTLGSLTLQLYDDEPDLGAPEIDYGVTSSPLSLEPAQTMATVSAFREQTWPVRLPGVRSLDENARECAVRLQNNLDAELSRGANTLAITRRGSDVVTTYRVKKNQVPKVPFTRVFDKGGILYVPVTLTVGPWAEGALEAQTLATSLATPNVVDALISGGRPTPLSITVTRGFSGSGLQTLILGRIPATFGLEDLLKLAKDGGAPHWDPYTATSGYESGPDNVRICTAEDWRAIIWGALPLGRYALFAKTRVQTGGRGWLAQCRSLHDPSAPPVAVSDNDWRFVFIGDYASDGYTSLRLTGKCRESANGILVDWLLPVPLDYGSPFYFHCTAQAVASVTTEWLKATMQLTSGARRSALRYAKGPGVQAVGTARLVVAACDADGALRRPSVTLEETHTPLFTHWVPTPEV